MSFNTNNYCSADGGIGVGIIYFSPVSLMIGQGVGVGFWQYLFVSQAQGLGETLLLGTGVHVAQGYVF